MPKIKPMLAPSNLLDSDDTSYQSELHINDTTDDIIAELQRTIDHLQNERQDLYRRIARLTENNNRLRRDKESQSHRIIH